MKLKDRLNNQPVEDSFNLFFKNYPHPIWIYDLKTFSFLNVNDAAVKVYGYSRKKFLTMSLKDIRPKEDAAKLLKNISKKRALLQHSGIWKHQLKNGKVIDVEIISHTINYQNRKAALVTAKNVTKEMTLQRELSAVRNEFHTTLYSIGDGVISVDIKNRIVVMNKTAEKLTGWEENEAKGKLLSTVFKIINEETRKKVEDPVTKVLRKGIVVRLANHTLLIMKDGTECPIADSGAPIINNKGNITGVVLVFRDQSNERKLLNRISKLNRVYSILSDTNQTIIRVKDKIQLFKEACRIAVEDGGFVLAWVGMINSNSSKVNVVESFGKSKNYLKKINIDLNDKLRSKGPTGQAFKTRKHIICNNILKDFRMLPWRKDAIKYGFKSSAAFPIKIFNRVVGSFNLYSKDEDYFTKDEVKLFDELASDLSYALEFIEQESNKKLSEQALLESESKYRELYENLRDAFVRVDMKGRILEFNLEYSRMLGYDPEEIKSLTYKDITPKKWHKLEEKIIKEQVMANGYSEVYEKEYRRKDGTVFSVELRTVLIFDSEKNPKGMWAIIRDITQRKRAEESLRENEHLLKESQLVAGLGSYVLNIKTGIWKSSELLDKVFGIDKTYSRTIEGWLNIVHPDHRMEMSGYFINEVLGKHLRFDKQYKIIRKNDGLERWVHGLGELEFDELHQPIKMLGTIQDISKRMIAEQALRQSEKQKRLIIESLPVAIYESPNDPKIDAQWVSNNIESLTGYTVEEYLSDKNFWRNRLHPEDKGKVLNLYNLSRSTGIFEMEYRWFCKDGNYKWFYDKSLLINNFGKEEYLGVIVDINNLKQTEESLIKAEAKYRKFFDEDLSGDFISTVDGEILTCNPAFARIFGYDSVEEIMKVNTASIYRSTSEREQFLNLIREKKSLTLFEENLIAKDDKGVTVLENVVGEFDENNNLIQLKGYLFDITARKKMGEAIEKQLKFAIAANKISEIIISTDNENIILDKTVQIVGETLMVDRALIYNVNFKKYLAMGLCEWLNPLFPDVASTRADYPLSIFIAGATEMRKTGEFISSHNDEVDSNFIEDGSGEILHNLMQIKSLLWYPFAFYEEGYYLLVLNQVYSKRKWSKEEIVFLSMISKQISIAFKQIKLYDEIKTSREQLKTLSNRIEKLREEERTNISREIHDTLGQNLTAAKIDLVTLMKNPPDKNFAKEKIEPLIKLVEDSIQTVRKISADLRPGILDQLGLIDSLEWQLSEFKKRTKIKTSYDVLDQSIKLSNDKTIAMFRVFQELLTNIVRHSEADEVRVKLYREDENILLSVEDNGKGIEEGSITDRNSIGILGMKERMDAVGGVVNIFGETGKGTKVFVVVPID